MFPDMLDNVLTVTAHIMDRIRLLLLVDYVLVRESLSRQLRLEPDFEIVAECGTAAEGLEVLSRSPMNVVLLDYDAVGDQAVQFISAARAAGYQGTILVLASDKDTASLFMPLRAGASGVFLKHSSLDSLPRAIRQVAAGEAWVDLAVLQLLAGPIAERENINLHSLLTKRERQVLEGVVEGLTNKTIASQIGVSEGATKAILREIFRKAGVRRRGQLVRVALTGSPGNKMT
jgi:DNA-binding NarL/FixJ family response regulator